MTPSDSRRNPLLAYSLIAGCALVVILLAGCSGAQKQRQPRVSVTVTRVENRSVPFALVTSGTVEPIRTAAVGSQVGGVLRRVAFREGSEVREGQVLFQLDDRPFRTSLEQARATLAKDRAQATTARLEAERARALLDQNVVSQSEYEQKQAAAETWAATVRGDSASAATALLQLEYATIRAPISGRTGRLLVHEGDLIRAATADALVTINQTRPVRVSFSVPVSAVPLVQRYRRANPRVLVGTADPDSEVVDGALVFVDNAVDPASGTLLLKGEFPNRDGRLVPGQFVDVRLVLYDDPNAMVVPAAAVTNGQQGTYVYVMNADSTVATRPVNVSRTVDEVAVVSSGLKPGETVITEGQLRLSPGARVVVREPQAKATAARGGPSTRGTP